MLSEDLETRIARGIAFAGLGTANGAHRPMPEDWTNEEQWRLRILECIPAEAETRCRDLAKAILELVRAEGRQSPGERVKALEEALVVALGAKSQSPCNWPSEQQWADVEALLSPQAAPVEQGEVMTAVDLLKRMDRGMLVFLDGRNEHGSHVLSSLITHMIDDASGALEEQAEEILQRAEALGFQIGAHVWARFTWIREEYHHGYWEFADIDEGVTRLYHATFPGSDGNDPANEQKDGAS